MKVAVMQPYLFPYIGYFQLMHAVDVFVLYDDVQYIKRGWINRNRIQIDGVPVWMTMPVLKSKRHLPINERQYQVGPSVSVRLCGQLQSAYRRSQYFESTRHIIFPLIENSETNVARHNAHALTRIAKLLGIGCQFVVASDLPIDRSLRGEQRIQELCRVIRATTYINPIGGVQLYSEKSFRAAGIPLCFLRTDVAPTSLSSGNMYLSILDSMFIQGIVGTAERLHQYSLLSAKAARQISSPV